MADYKTILVATDLSEPASVAARHAADLARRLGSEIVLTYVIESRLPALILAQTGKSEDELLGEYREHAEKSLDAWTGQHLAGVEVDSVIRTGAPHEEIVQLARERQADLIVVGMHGHGFLTHALSGSTAERVLHIAHCPVLVVGQPHD